MTILSRTETVTIDAPAEVVYDLVSDITRMGEWSPVCVGGEWDDPDRAGEPGQWFTGHNRLPEREWQTRCQVETAEPGREFTWTVGEQYVRWGYHLEQTPTGTALTERWAFLPAGLAMFRERFGDQAEEGMPRPLAAIKDTAEG